MTNKYLKFLVFFFGVIYFNATAQSVVTHPFLDNTITSWHQFSVAETGVQKITKEFLKKLDIPVDDIDPKTLRIFGRGGQMLPLLNTNSVETLYENAIWVVGEADGSFDDDDYILFMGYIGDSWNYESQTFVNLYHNSATYYITYGTSNGKRVLVNKGIATISSNAKKAGVYQAKIEADKYNLGALGRRWFGESFNNDKTESYTLQTPNVQEDETITVAARVAAVSNTNTTFLLSSGGNSAKTSMAKTSGTIIATEPRDRLNGISGHVSVEHKNATEISAELSYTSNGDFSSRGYLDYIFAQYSRTLTGTGGSFLFTLDAASSKQQIAIANPTEETTLWVLDNETVYASPPEVKAFGVNVLAGEESTYYLATDYKTPTYGRSTRVFSPNPFLSQMMSSSPTTYLLITTEEFKDEAERLIAHRNKSEEMHAQLVTLEEIYEAFSTDQQDIAAIRNFIRYVYFTQNKQLKYLCLFGDTSYDYQNRSRSNDMIVPTFHALNSFSLTNSYMSDDFFTMMDDNEGLLSASDKMDLAVGRMVFSDKIQARTSVDKVIEYESPQNKGSWNNSFTLLSDDVDLNWEYVIQERLDELGDELYSNKPFFNITKLHSDAFEQVASAGGDRYPDVQDALENRLSQGTLVVNYFGHGGEDGLSNEFLLDRNMAATLFHPGRYPLFITSTCEFARFDNHDRKTAGELLYQNPTGGAIGLISTTRQIYVTNGINYNNILSKYLFSFGSDDYTSISEALRRAKSEFSDNNQKRILYYIGDPALKLHIPNREVKITHVNGVAIDSATDSERQIKALDKITLQGAVYNYFDEPQSDFNGTVMLQVFDKKVERTTLGNDGHKKMMFYNLGQQLFQGLSVVENGMFSSTFVVPKDIDLNVGEARISMVAFNDDKSELLGGFSEELSIGGLNLSTAEDNQGPLIDVFLNDKSFIDGSNVFNSPTLIIDLEDENGINTAGGIGHDITAVLDNDQTSPYVLNAFYATSQNDFTSGSLSFPFSNLDLGRHTLTIEAWDTHNNSSTKTIAFWVVDNSKIEIENIFNSPNPVTNQTTFFIKHNRPKELLKANLYIFTIDGKRIWHTSEDVFSTGYMLDSLRWDATSYNGQKVNKGTYLYTIELISTLSQTNSVYSSKLIIN